MSGGEQMLTYRPLSPLIYQGQQRRPPQHSIQVESPQETACPVAERVDHGDHGLGTWLNSWCAKACVL